MHRRAATIVAAALSQMVPATARADSTMCAVGRLVETGETLARVLYHCGNPSYRDAYDARGWRGTPVTHIEEWIYDLGPGSFLRLLHFENGMLVWIRVFSR
jgi:Protein of unknown function (DUF2845)